MIMNKHNTFPSSNTTHTNIEDAELGSEFLQSFLQDATSIITCGPPRRFSQGVVTLDRGFKESAVVSLTVSRSQKPVCHIKPNTYRYIWECGKTKISSDLLTS